MRIFGDRNGTYPDLIIERLDEDSVALCDLGPASGNGLLYFKNLLKSVRRRYDIVLTLEPAQDRQAIGSQPVIVSAGQLGY